MLLKAVIPHLALQPSLSSSVILSTSIFSSLALTSLKDQHHVVSTHGRLVVLSITLPKSLGFLFFDLVTVSVQWLRLYSYVSQMSGLGSH